MNDYTQTVIQTMLNQLTNSNNGQSRLAAMIGMTNCVYGVDSNENIYVTFKFKMCRKISHFKITYNRAADLYDIAFLKTSKYEFKIVSEEIGVYGDMLKNMFEKETGLYLSF